MKINTNALAIAAIAVALRLRHSSASSSSKASKATQHSSYLIFDQGGKSGKSVSNASSSKITANIKSKSSKSQPYFTDEGIIRAEIEQEVEEGDEVDEQEPVSDSTFVSIPPSPSVSLVSGPNDIDVVVGVNVTDVTLDINTYSNKSEAASKSSKSYGGSSSRGRSYSIDTDINEIELVDKIEEFISILDSKSTPLTVSISSASSDDVDKTEEFNEDIEDDSQLQSQQSQSYSYSSSTPTILLPLSRASIVVSNQQAASIGSIKSSEYRYGKGCKMTKAAKMFKEGNNSASTISVVSLKSKAPKFVKEEKMFKDIDSSPIIVKKSKALKMFKEMKSSVDASSTPQLPTPSIVISKATKATKLFKKEEEDSFFIGKSKAGKFFKSTSVSTSPSSTGCRQ